MTGHPTTRPGSPAYPARYAALDGWRGVAAVGVVLHHVGVVRYVGAADLGHASVLLFFVISGYCISAAAAGCAQKGYGFRTFMKRRVWRIYPPYLFAVGYWAATRLVKAEAGLGNDLGRPWADYLQNVTMTQWVSLLAHPVAAPQQNPVLFVAPFWSLNYEEQFYLLVAGLLAVGGVRRGTVVGPALALAAASAAYRVAAPGTFHGLFIDYWLHFAVGVLLYHRLCRFDRRWQRRAADAGLAVAAAAGLAAAGGVVPVAAGHQFFATEVAIVSAFALVLTATRSPSDTVMASRPGRALAALGLISYSLYLIHICNLMLVARVAGRVVPEAVSWHANVLVQLAAHVAIAAVFWAACERPFLNRRLDPRPAGPAAATPS